MTQLSVHVCINGNYCQEKKIYGFETLDFAFYVN